MSRFIIAVFLIISCFSCGEKSSEQPTSEDVVNENIPSNRISVAYGNGRIEASSPIIKLASASSGILTEILKKENEMANKGETLAILDVSEEENEILRLSAELRALLKKVQIDSGNLQKARGLTQNALIILERTQNLFKQGAETQEMLDDITLEYDSELTELNNAKTKIQQTSMEIKALRASLNGAMAKKNKKIIKAPQNGKVLEWKIQVGEGIQTTGEVAQFAPSGDLIAECEIDEFFADKLRMHQKVNIRSENGGAVTNTGRIIFLSDFLKRKSIFGNNSSEPEDRRVRIVKVSLEQQEELLINARVQCEILLD